ncbi:hypothetical protein B0H13DRAFT_1855428 [Mycena leptocephala]|nr:hypothetical protein B0H13DRAFT_1855428 [Mycena leptocephala]
MGQSRSSRTWLKLDTVPRLLVDKSNDLLSIQRQRFGDLKTKDPGSCEAPLAFFVHGPLRVLMSSTIDGDGRDEGEHSKSYANATAARWIAPHKRCSLPRLNSGESSSLRWPRASRARPHLLWTTRGAFEAVTGCRHNPMMLLSRTRLYQLLPSAPPNAQQASRKRSGSTSLESDAPPKRLRLGPLKGWGIERDGVNMSAVEYAQKHWSEFRDEYLEMLPAILPDIDDQ